VWTLVGVLDGNGTGANANAGPGVNLEIPVFNRNQGGIARADAEIERASRQYTAVRAQVLTDVRSSSARVRQAEQAAAAWRTEVVPSLEGELRQAERAYQAGEIPLYVLLEGNRRLLEGRSRLLDADADLQRAAIALERSIGRSCQPH
jgi:cobalt-zinc-cadmium efflux system outer membrane protein